MVYQAPGERDDCHGCGSSRIFDLDVLPLRGGRTGFVCCCDSCGLVFSNPQPTDQELAAFYLLARTGWIPVAPPPLKVGMGSGGRQTTARLRVLARRAEHTVEPAIEVPSEDARAALMLYYADSDRRPLAARAGLMRIAARKADAERRRAKSARKVAARPRAQSEATGA